MILSAICQIVVLVYVPAQNQNKYSNHWHCCDALVRYCLKLFQYVCWRRLYERLSSLDLMLSVTTPRHVHSVLWCCKAVSVPKPSKCYTQQLFYVHCLVVTAKKTNVCYITAPCELCYSRERAILFWIRESEKVFVLSLERKFISTCGNMILLIF